MSTGVVNIIYLLAASLFIIGLRGLSHPRTAVRGNLISAFGMLLAIIATLVVKGIANWELILAGLVAGSLIGAVLAIRIQMSAMPQLVGLYNGFGGIASVLVAGAVLYHLILETLGSVDSTSNFGLQEVVATAASALIGAVTFWGSLIAFGKELLRKNRYATNSSK